METSREIRIGTAGWSYKDWDGVFYPPGMQRGKRHALEFLAQCFDVVEINTSFYGHIKPELVKLWVRKVAVNPKFMFTAKLHRSFTHSPIAVMEPTSAATIKPNDEDERLAREGLDALASTGKLGALLIQFPVSYKNTSLNREYLEQLLRQFIEFPRVVEVRHESWNNPETLRYFTERNVAFCNIDQPLIGRSNYLYSDAELTGWKEKIERIAHKAEVTYVVANNHFEAKAGVNALQLKHALSGERVKATEMLLKHYPELKSIADPIAGDNDGLPLLSMTS
jgi:uncharacterized protein YecE (DUF72 family)